MAIWGYGSVQSIRPRAAHFTLANRIGHPFGGHLSGARRPVAHSAGAMQPGLTGAPKNAHQPYLPDVKAKQTICWMLTQRRTQFVQKLLVRYALSAAAGFLAPDEQVCAPALRQAEFSEARSAVRV